MAEVRAAARRTAAEPRRPRPAPLRAVASRAEPPLPPARLVDRPRLRDALLGAAPMGLAVVIAPGGFGKTVALADMATHAPFPTAWLTITQAEADLVAFVEAVTGVVRRTIPRFGRQAVKIARQTGGGAVPALADELASELADYGAPLGLVLDDFHAADGAGDVGRLVTALVERAPPNFFLAIASRTLPALPYARLLALGRMAGVPADELRFTAEETALFLGRAPGDAEAERIHDSTGGWAAALALGEGSTGFIGAIEEYLEHEVFGQQAPEVREFLLRAAVPPTLDEDVCRRILDAPNGPAILSRAHRGGLFVAALPDGGWRIHDLFRDFLRTQLRQRDPLLWEHLNRAVADDLAAARRPLGARSGPVEAVTQLVEADLAEAAADMLLAHADAFAAQGRWGAIRGWLDRLPPRVVEARPRLLTLQGRALMPSSPAAALGLFDRAIDLCLNAGDDVGAAEGLAHRAARLGMSGRYDEASQDCDRAIDLIGGRPHPALATVLRIQGTVAGRLGDFERAEERLAQALGWAERYRDVAAVATCERALGWLHSFRGEIGAATARYERAARLWGDLADLVSAADVRVSLGHVYAEQGAAELARQSFQEALEIAERLDESRIRAYALDNLAVLQREAGNPGSALGLLNAALELARRIDDVQLVALCLDQIAQTQRLLPDGAPTAEALARQAIAEAERGRLVSVAARATTTLAAVILAQGRTSEALTTAREAIGSLEAGGSKSDQARARLCAAVADRILGGEDWREDLRQVGATLEEVRNRGFLRAEASAFGEVLEAMASDERVRSVARAVMAASTGEPAQLPPKADPTLPRVEANLLGRPELLVDGAAPDDPGRRWSRRSVRLLFFLLEQARQGLSADALVSRLWPDAEPGHGQSLLWDTVHRLRLVLSGSSRRGRETVVLENGIYRLNPELPLRTDAAAFEANATRGLNTAVGSREEIEALTAADALYRGPYLDTYDEPWMVVRRGELSRLHVRVLRRLVERAIEDGPAERALELGARLARLQPRSRMACELYLRTLRAAGELERATQVERAFARRTTAPDDTTSASSRTRRA